MPLLAYTFTLVDTGGGGVIALAVLLTCGPVPPDERPAPSLPAETD
ncbi:hypothetical protein [Actinoallomurus iriomotensis]|nr:hypothetical protein [Actinoallomurus iriomotensis]